MKSAPNSPGAPAAILDWARVDDHTNSYTSEYFRIKVFTEEGKKYGDVELTYIPGYPSLMRITEISARTIQPDGRIVPFDGKVFDKLLYKSGRFQMKAKTFSLANVQPGSILEYRYQRRWPENTVMNAEWVLQRDIPIVHAKLELTPTSTGGEFSSFLTHSGLPEGKGPKRIGGTYYLELNDLPALADEAFAPPRNEARVNFFYLLRSLRREHFWTVQWADWTKAIEKFIGGDDAYRAHVQKAGTPQTLKDLYAKAQSWKNLSYAGEGAEERSRNAAEVLSKGSGYSHEITRAFVGLARAAGFDASVVRVAPRDENFFAVATLDADQLSDEVAAVIVDGRPLYLDPGTPGAPFGIVSWEKTNTPGMRIAKTDALQWLKVAAARPDDALLQRRADLHMNGQSIEGTVTVTFAGQEALRRRANTWSDDDETRKKAFEKEAKAWFAEDATVKVEEITGVKTHEGPLVAKYSVKVPAAMAGTRVTVPLSFFAATQKNPFAPATRRDAIYFRYPYRVEDEVVLTLPENLTPAALPVSGTFDVGAMKYAGVATRDGRKITFKRSMTVDAMLIEAKHYDALRNFYNAVVAADQRPLLLVSAN